jgi:hypothetical protein
MVDLPRCCGSFLVRRHRAAADDLFRRLMLTHFMPAAQNRMQSFSSSAAQPAGAATGGETHF